MHDAQVNIIRDRAAPIGRSELYPHYSDRRFILPQRSRTVFLAPDAVLLGSFRQTYERANGIDSYEHSGLVLAGQIEAWDAVRHEHGERDDEYERTAEFFEALLGKVLGQSVEIKHILSGVNTMGDGNPYQDFGVKLQ
jgi:hypothetical protein